MKCPKCRTPELKPTKLEQGLPAMACGECQGAFLSLLYYRDWSERHVEWLAQEPSEQRLQPQDTATAMACPKCGKLMSKYAISADSNHRLDVCHSCDEAWLDGGEWTMLKQMDLALVLPKLFTEQWQKQVRHEKMQQIKFDRLQQQVGEELAAKALEVKQWLQTCEHQKTLLQFIGSD